MVVIIITASLGFNLYKKYSADRAFTVEKAKDESQTSSSKKDSQMKSSGNKEDIADNTIKQDIPNFDGHITITSTSQSSGKVSATAQLSTDTGDCVFSYTTEGDRPVIAKAPAIKSVCAVSTPEVEFSKLGDWNLNVTAYTNGKKAEVNKIVTID